MSTGLSPSRTSALWRHSRACSAPSARPSAPRRFDSRGHRGAKQRGQTQTGDLMSEPSHDVASTRPTAAPASGWRRFGVYVLLLFAIVAWGGSWVAARMLLAPQTPGTPALSPTMLATVRFIMASVLLLPALVRQHTRVRRFQPRDLLIFLLLGQLSIS